MDRRQALGPSIRHVDRAVLSGVSAGNLRPPRLPLPRLFHPSIELALSHHLLHEKCPQDDAAVAPKAGMFVRPSQVALVDRGGPVASLWLTAAVQGRRSQAGPRLMVSPLRREATYGRQWTRWQED